MDLEMVSYLSRLGKLSFTEEELKKTAEEIYLNDLRKDASEPSMPTQKILQNALNSEDCFVVPKVVE